MGTGNKAGLLLQLLQPAFCFGDGGTEFEGFLVVGDCGFGHVLMLTLLAEHDVFHGELLEEFLLPAHFFLEATVLLAQGVDDVQLATDEAAHEGFLYIISAMDCLEEIGEETLEVALVETLHGIMIFPVCLGFGEGLVYHGLVVVVA